MMYIHRTTSSILLKWNKSGKEHRSMSDKNLIKMYAKEYIEIVFKLLLI
jgi:hypothetical protein